MSPRHLTFVACAAGAGASVLGLGQFVDQLPLGRVPGLSPGGFNCDLPPPINPTGDGLPSTDELFSSDVALRKQVERHQAIVRVPSVSFDDLGEPTEDERWAPFFDLHKVLEVLYPNM